MTSLPATSFESLSPVYSPDRTKIAFCFAIDDGSVDIYVMDAEGGNLTQVTHDGAFLVSHWSPDGKRLVFGRIADTGVGVVTTIRADGSDVRSVTSEYWDSFVGIYTPDGKQIVYYSQDGGYVAVVWMMDFNGSHKHPLTVPTLEGFPGDVSADGHHITGQGEPARSQVLEQAAIECLFKPFSDTALLQALNVALGAI